MNIRTDYLDALKRLEQQPQKSATVSTGEDFATLLSQEVGRPELTEGAGLSASGLRTGTIDPALFVSALNGTESIDETEDQGLLDTVMGQTSGLLDSWGEYADSLAGGTTPRAAWTALNGMDSQLLALRGSLAGLSKSNPGLESMVNELAVMTATEKFKINRGDYV